VSRLSFTIDAVAQMDPTRLGELIQDRVRKGATSIEIITIEEAVGRLSAMGVPVTVDAHPLEVEPIPIGRRKRGGSDA